MTNISCPDMEYVGVSSSESYFNFYVTVRIIKKIVGRWYLQNHSSTEQLM